MQDSKALRAMTDAVAAPFATWTKAEIAAYLRPHCDLAVTWSCYAPTDRHEPCGACNACVERAQAIA